MTTDKRSNPPQDARGSSEDHFEAWQKYAEPIKPGMTREQVEIMLNQLWGGIQGELVTIYHPKRGIKLEVPFDRQPTPGHRENKVIGAARISMVAY